MNIYKIHIQKHSVVLLLLLFSGWVSYAQKQLTAKVGETTKLSVNEVYQHTYVWELYDRVQDVNFAITQGNCPENKAEFTKGNTKASVQVKWLQPGIYFYKVTISNNCSNNVKIGKIIITEADIPSTPKITVVYNCDEESATLKATDYQGELLWSTGETSETIKVSKKGSYTLVQTLNNQQSLPASVSIENTKIPNAPNASVSPTSIELGESATLIAEGCADGTLFWYSDQQLTQQIENTTISPIEAKTYTYYAVCKSNADCESPYTKVVLTVKTKNNCPILLETMKIPQGFSPNGDGINDVWELKDLETYCNTCKKEAKVMIFDRWGLKVYEKEKYMLTDERFNGYSKNNMTVLQKNKLPVGTYFYIIEIEGKFVKTGYLYIKY